MEKHIEIMSDQEAKGLFGRHDEYLKLVESGFSVTTSYKNGALKVIGDDRSVDKAAKVLGDFLVILKKGGTFKKHDISYAVKALKEESVDIQSIYLDRIEVSAKRASISPKSKGQKHYVDAIRNNDIVFAIGPAGTGKTYLAMAMAVNALRKKIVSRIILTRPAVEAGESLGFLPGSLNDKVTPYLRPIYDALYDMVDIENIQDYINNGVIEIAPLAYMRGRTLNDAFIILDEGLNATVEQMKMFLTRLGFDSKTVVTGDITQSDLPRGRESGLNQVQKILAGIKGIEFVYLRSEDVVRHELVQEIIKAYEAHSEQKN